MKRRWETQLHNLIELIPKPKESGRETNNLVLVQDQIWRLSHLFQMSRIYPGDAGIENIAIFVMP